MPVSKLTFKENHLHLHVEDLEFSVGAEIFKVGKLSVKLDVNDLLRAKLPALAEGRPAGISFVSFGEKKIQCIKEIRTFTGMALRDAKELSEQSPGFIDTSGKSEQECLEFCATIGGYGGTAELVRSDQNIPSVMDKLREMLAEALSKEVQ